MQSHLTIKANGKHLALPDDFTIDLDYQNPMFNDAESFSYPCEIPIKGNGNLLKNVADRKADMRPVDLEDTKARIYADGLPIFDGKLKTSDDEELDTALSMNIEGGETLDSLISDLDCQDIPVKDKILIGEKIGEVVASVKGNYIVRLGQGDNHVDFKMGKQTGEVTFTPQALGFSVPYRCTADITSNATKKSESVGDNGYVRIIPKKYGETDTNPGETYINVSYPYGSGTDGETKQYCNGKVSYKHYKLADDGTTDTDNTTANPYMVLDAERPASGICFYVQYFLDCLFDYLGLEWDNSALKAIEDFNRLCFYTTKCGFDEEIIETKDYSNFDTVNKWLNSRGCGAQLSLVSDWGDISSAYIPNGTYYDDSKRGNDCQLLDDTFDASHGGLCSGESYSGVKVYWSNYGMIFSDWWDNVQLKASLQDAQVTNVKVNYCKMYANSENWPDTTVSTILNSLENQFGIRFVYDAEQKKVTAKLLRDLYRTQSTPKDFLGQIHQMNKVSEKITGVRVCYSDESDSKEQKDNLRDSERDYDTNYDYIDYPDPNAKRGTANAAKACTTVINQTYKDFCNRIDATDNTCYIDQQTGDAYRIKVNSENNKDPAWFEVGQFKGVEMGDCSAKNEDYVVEFASDFQPLVLSDANADKVRAACSTGNSTAINLVANQPVLVPFCDEDMEHEYVEQHLNYPITIYNANTNESINGVDVTVRAELHLLENYDVEGTGGGNSPLQDYDWGLAVAIMRGGGSDATTYVYDNGYDGFGNSKWGQTVGNYAMTVDSIDQMGNLYDYNGDQPGLMKGERFSLKIRAFKGELTTWANGNALCADDECVSYQKYLDTTTDNPVKTKDEWKASLTGPEGWYYIKNRGTFDRFMYEHAYFLLHRRKFIVRASVTPAFLQDIRNHWTDRWKILDETGFINKVSVSVDIKKGVQEAEIEFYAL